MKLPSELLKVEKTEGSAAYDITINQNISFSDQNQTRKHEPSINILPSVIGVTLEGLVYDKTNQDTSCGVITVLNKRKQIFYLTHQDNNKENIFGSKSPANNLEGMINVSGLTSGKHTLQVRVLNHECSGYYDTFTMTINKSAVDSLLELPVEKKKLRGWVEKFDVHKDKIYIEGWYTKEEGPALSKTLLLEISGKKYVTRYGYERSDVAKVMNDEAYSKSGFKLTVNKNEISSGKHIVKVFLLSDDKTVFYEDSQTFLYEVK